MLKNNQYNMSSFIENIENIELTSPASTKSYIKTKFKISENKVGSPSSSLTAHSDIQNDTRFSTKMQNSTQPQPTQRRFSRITTSTSESQETLNSLNERHSNDVAESTFSSKSDTRSHRQKFRERFDMVKRQTGISVSKAKGGSEKSLNKSMVILRKENQEIDAELRNYKQNRIVECHESGDHISKIDAYNFFCKINDTAFNDENYDHEEHKTTEFSELTDVENGNHQTDAHFLPADNLEFNVQISENELFWRPSRERLNLTEKLESDEPRILEEEGYYTEDKPKISPSILNIVEQRLLSSHHDKKWFNCEGNLNLLPSPYRKTSYKPQTYLKNNRLLSTEYVPAKIIPQSSENIFIPYMNTLELSIFAITFKHHPLFSSEHVLEQKLITAYDTYNQKLKTNKLERIIKRLDALRNAKKNIQLINDNKQVSIKKIQSYGTDIIKLRELYFTESKHNRMLLKSILKIWQAIKKIRKLNNYASTTIKLNIRKEKCSYEQEKLIWDKEIQECRDEIVSELDLEYEKTLSAYIIELEQWKLKSQNDENKPVKKPRKPLKQIDPDTIMEEVTDTFKESIKPPGEPLLHFSLSYDNECKENNDNPKEKFRKNAVATSKVCLKILCNNIEVCKSKLIPLTDKYVCIFDESFIIQLSTIPDKLTIEIYEQPSTLMKRKLGVVKIAIPPLNVIAKQSKIYEEYFQKEEIVHYKHEGVGSGIELKDILPDSDDTTLYTSGVVSYQINWDRKHTNAQNEEDIVQSTIIKSVLNEDGTIDVKKLIQWAKENNPDPQDPKNSVLYEYIQNYDEDFETPLDIAKPYFRCDPDKELLEFCDSQDIENNLRFKLLQLRDSNEPEFVGMVIPNRLKEIPSDILDKYYQRRDKENQQLIYDEEIYDNDKIASIRAHGQKYLKQVYIKVFQKCRNTANNLVYEDVVNEKVIPYIEIFIRNIVSYIINWFQVRPTINITRSKTIRHSPKTINLNRLVKICINIKSALNVPLRNAVGSRSTTNDFSDERTIKPFVVVTYENRSVQTLTAEGINPVWNEELTLPLESTNTDHLSPNSLSGSISIDLFDETLIKSRSGNVKGKNWLGSIKVPLSAIAYSSKIEGLFKLHKPSTLFGYDQNIEKTASNNQIKLDQQVGTYLSLKMALQPNVPKLTQNMNQLETTELPYIKEHIINWNNAYNNEFQARKFSALAIDINGKSVCVTRYIRPLEPPQLNSDRFNVSADQCAKYVSMIPFTDSNKFYQNVWLSTEQLLKLTLGSIIDHAVALTCYLTALDIEAWLLLGYGIPHGATAYVLVREYVRDQQIPLHSIYDVNTGMKYDITDTLCPLQRIFCIVNEYNVWANTQRTDQIQLTQFDFLRRCYWLPLFTSQITAPTISAQQKLIYSTTPDIKQLEIKIDKRIRKKISKLRIFERTLWNNHLTQIFKNAIERCEFNNMDGKRIIDINQHIEDVWATHFVNGYIINMPYTNISTIIDHLLLTGIHFHEALHTEFALAIRIYAYPNQVLAVWICLASISPK